MKKLLISLISLLCVVSCNDNVEIADFDSFQQSSTAISKSSNLDLIHQRIGQKTQTRSNFQTNIEPYLYEGDTVMYIVNYEDGWELLSNDTSVPMVVAHADEGFFVKDSLPQSMMVYFDNIAKNLYDRIAAGLTNSDIVGEWNYFGDLPGIIDPYFPRDTFIVDVKDTLIYGLVQIVNYDTIIGSGSWVPIDTIYHTVTIQNEGTLKIESEWSAGWPWNMFAPMYEKGNRQNNHAAVMVAQYLTYLRRMFNADFLVADSLTYDSSVGEYIPARYSTTILDHVANTIYDSSVEVQNAATVIRGITYDMNTIYYNGKPITELNKTRTYLTGLGFGYQSRPITYNNLYNKLHSRIPLLLPILDNTATDNDFYCLAMATAVRRSLVKSRIRYGWLGFDKNGNPTIEYENGTYYYKYQSYQSTDYIVDEMRARWIDGIIHDNTWITLDGGIQQNINGNEYLGSSVWDLSLYPYF